MNRNEKFIFENGLGQQLEFSNWSSFFISEIEGISGVKNTIYNNKGMNQDGFTYTGSTIDGRNILIQGAIIDNTNLNRSRLLSIFNPKLQAKLNYKNETLGINRYLECLVEQAPIINKDNKPKFQISLLCPNPYWKDCTSNKVNIALWEGDFHFPLIIPQNKGITMGHRKPSLIVNVKNNGDLITGMKIEFKALGNLKNPSLYNVNTREYLKINKVMEAGEIITVNTNIGAKKIESYKNGFTTNILNLIDIYSTFLQLSLGDNLFRYDADENLNNLEVNIYFSSQYLGV